ncbi:flagellar hook-basal body complex protein FliE [Effusibacillus pohliae]|uniref:flagellar hook-basal body complex protein FliE n=1 Tax=Effusibacillus pohliae TaxID=232270 RepID=UPI00036CD2BA|nr:flagellar hook-basal body complex protein FliE [Effusibacillus pohliae]
MIRPISQISPLTVGETGVAPKTASQESFASVLGNILNKVAEMETQSANLGYQLAAGQGGDIHNVMIAGEKASLALQMTVQVRNKVVEAYQEVMRMQI